MSFAPLLASAIALALLMFNPYWGWLAAFLVKPIVDTGWDISALRLFGFSALELIGAGLPTIVLVRMMFVPADRPRHAPLRGLWIAYILSVVCGAMMGMLEKDYVGAVSFFLRSLNGLAAFYSIHHLFGHRNAFRVFLISILIAGLFPLGIGLYEIVTGVSFRGRSGRGEQIRVAGVYQNSTTLRYAAYMTLTAIALFWVYFVDRAKWLKLVLLVYSGVTLLVLFRTFSKAGYGSIVFAALVWVFIGRKFVWPVIVVVMFLVVNLITGNFIFEQISNTFIREVDVLQGEEKSTRLFAGRIPQWQENLERFSRQDFINQLFGGDMGGRLARAGGHNDYIRALRQTGIIGAIIYATLLIGTGLTILRRAMRTREPIAIVGLMVFGAWMVDSIGLTPAAYTQFQWYVWGFVGLALGGVVGLTHDRSRRGQGGTIQPTTPNASISGNGASPSVSAPVLHGQLPSRTPTR